MALITWILLAVGTGVWIAWDCYAVAKDNTASSSISRQVLTAAMKHPALAFALGFVFGHILWPNAPLP